MPPRGAGDGGRPGGGFRLSAMPCARDAHARACACACDARMRDKAGERALAARCGGGRLEFARRGRKRLASKPRVKLAGRKEGMRPTPASSIPASALIRKQASLSSRFTLRLPVLANSSFAGLNARCQISPQHPPPFKVLFLFFLSGLLGNRGPRIPRERLNRLRFPRLASLLRILELKPPFCDPFCCSKPLSPH